MQPLAALVRDLTAAGAPPEAVAVAIGAIEKLQSEMQAEMRAALDGLRKPGRERLREWRAQKKAEEAKRISNVSESLPKHISDVSETADSPPSPPPDKAPPDPLKITPPISPRPIEKTARAGRLPADWEPKPFGPRTQAALRAERMGPDWVEDALENFRAHWAASATPNAKKMDWQGAWANWLEIAERKGRPNGRGQSIFAGASAFQRAVRRDPALAMLRQAQAEIDSGSDPGTDR